MAHKYTNYQSTFTDDREKAADDYERFGCQLFLNPDSSWMSQMGAQAQRRMASIEYLATHIAGGSPLLTEGGIIKAVRAEVSPVAMYRNILDPSTFTTASQGSNPPAISQMQPIRTDSLFNVALKLIPGWSMAAAMQTATALMHQRAKTFINLSTIERAYKKTFTSSVSLLYFCTPVGFSSIFPALCTMDGKGFDIDTYVAFWKNNSAQPCGLGANEFCDSVCAALGAGYTADAIKIHYSAYLQEKGVEDVKLLAQNLQISKIADAFVRGLGLEPAEETPTEETPTEEPPSGGARAPKLKKASSKTNTVPATTVHIGQLHTSQTAPQPRLRVVCPFPFVFASETTEIFEMLQPFTKLLSSMTRDVSRSEQYSARAMTWIERLAWLQLIHAWVDDISKEFLKAYDELMLGPLDLTPEREVNERAVPYPTERTLARVVSDNLMRQDNTNAGALVMAAEIVPRATVFAIVVCGSTRVWKLNPTDEIVYGGSGEQTHTVATLSRQTALNVYGIARLLPIALLVRNIPLLLLDEESFGTAHCNASLLPPIGKDIESWFSRDNNIHMWLGNPIVSHYLEIALSMLHADSERSLHGRVVRLLDLQEIPSGVRVSQQTRQSVRTISVYFGFLVGAVYQNVMAEQSPTARNRPSNDPSVMDFAGSNLKHTRRLLSGLYFRNDSMTPTESYLALPPAGMGNQSARGSSFVFLEPHAMDS